MTTLEQDATVIQPAKARPYSTAPDAHHCASTLLPQTSGAPQSTEAPPPTLRLDLEIQFDLIQASLSGQSNQKPLLALASPLMDLIAKLNCGLPQVDIGQLHKTCLFGINQFNQLAQQFGVEREQRITSRYMLCTALDEAVLSTPWGQKSAWSERSLLSIFHQETTGGEKVFQVLERMTNQVSAYLEVIQLYYSCLMMGFEGQYRLQGNNAEKRHALCDSLYQIIRRHTSEHTVPLVIGASEPTGPDLRIKKRWSTAWIAAITAVVFVLSTGAFSGWSHHLQEPLNQRIHDLQHSINRF